MKKKVLIVGNDLNIQKLIKDILEITYDNPIISRVMDHDFLLSKVKEHDAKFDLIVFDFRNEQKKVKAIVPELFIIYPELLLKSIAIFESKNIFLDEPVIGELPHVIRPFSLDEFGYLIRRGSY